MGRGFVGGERRGEGGGGVGNGTGEMGKGDGEGGRGLGGWEEQRLVAGLECRS